MQFLFHYALQKRVIFIEDRLKIIEYINIKSNFEIGNEIPYRSVLLGKKILTGILTLQGGITVRYYSMKILLLNIF